MRMLIVSHYFPPEIGAPQARLSELARYWSAGGDRVTVLTGMPNHPTGRVHERYKGRIRMAEEVDGYKVIRTWLYATPNEGFVRKTLGHLSFMLSSVLLGYRKVGRPDVVLVSSPTFFSNFSALFLARMKRAKLVIEVRDLWPAIFVELGVLTDRRVIRTLERIELWLYRQADAVVAVTDGFRDNIIGRGIPATKVHTIRNGADLDRFAATDPPPGARERLGGREGRLLALYIGAHGISQNLSVLLDAASKLRSEPVDVALVGEGAEKRLLEQKAAELALPNLHMLPGVPSGDVPGLLQAGDVCVVSLRDIPLFKTFIPSKIFEYLAAGKPVVGSVAGESAAILEEAGAVVVPPGDGAALAEALRSLAADPTRQREMGLAGRNFVSQHFDRRQLARRYRELLVSVQQR